MRNLPYGNAICYSGFRKNQSPSKNIFPSYQEVKEDLLILDKDFDYIRMYHPSKHAETALEVIKKEKLNLKVMVGIDLLGEVTNPNCAWGGDYTKEQCKKHIAHNEEGLQNLIRLANEYPDIVCSVSAGNESVPEWNENLVMPERVLYFVKELKKHTKQPVTYCDNFYYWDNLLTDVAKEVDFISIHTYPVWTGHKIAEAFEVSLKEFKKVQETYPTKEIVITEAGWPTNSTDNSISRYQAKEKHQVTYVSQMSKWSKENEIVIFFFEAFDEPWKGSDNPNEPEKHWGFYYEDRTPKQIKK